MKRAPNRAEALPEQGVGGKRHEVSHEGIIPETQRPRALRALVFLFQFPCRSVTADFRSEAPSSAVRFL